jgi:hypothetical protein
MVEAMTLVWCSGPMNAWLVKLAEAFGAALAEAASMPLAASRAAPVAAIVVMTAADRLVGFMGSGSSRLRSCLTYEPGGGVAWSASRCRGL